MTEPVPTRAHREMAAQDLRDGHLSHCEEEALSKWIEDGANPCWGEGSRLEGEPVGVPDWYRSESTLADFAQLVATVERNARLEAETKWILASAELPDSDVRVLVRCTDGDIVSAELEFTDDSEGHGEPYWAAGDCGDLSFCNYPHWMPRPADPPSGGASDV